MAGAPQGSGRGAGFGLLGFLMMCFGVLGLTGLLAAHVAPLPLVRALQREAVLDEIATPDAEGRALLTKVAEKFGLSARAYHRILRVARTIADLAGSEGIGRIHVAEALSYRRVVGRS